MNYTHISTPPVQIKYPNYSMILLFGIYYPVTEMFTLGFANKLYDRYKYRFMKRVIKSKSRKTVKRYNALSSDGSKRYLIVHNVAGNVWNCNCKSFYYRKRCRHIVEAKEQQKACK